METESIITKITELEKGSEKRITEAEQKREKLIADAREHAVELLTNFEKQRDKYAHAEIAKTDAETKKEVKKIISKSEKIVQTMKIQAKSKIEKSVLEVFKQFKNKILE